MLTLARTARRWPTSPCSAPIATRCSRRLKSNAFERSEARETRTYGGSFGGGATPRGAGHRARFVRFFVFQLGLAPEPVKP